MPSQKLVDKLEVFQKKTLKQILSLPDNTANPSVYILSGQLPVQASLHLRVFSLFNNLCNQNDRCIEKQILIRQLTVKNDKSCAWAMHIPPLLARYGLESVLTYIENPVDKNSWKKYLYSYNH